VDVEYPADAMNITYSLHTRAALSGSASLPRDTKSRYHFSHVPVPKLSTLLHEPYNLIMTLRFNVRW